MLSYHDVSHPSWGCDGGYLFCEIHTLLPSFVRMFIHKHTHIIRETWALVKARVIPYFHYLDKTWLITSNFYKANYGEYSTTMKTINAYSMGSKTRGQCMSECTKKGESSPHANSSFYGRNIELPTINAYTSIVKVQVFTISLTQSMES